VLRDEVVALVIRPEGARVVRLGSPEFLPGADARLDPRKPAVEAESLLEELKARLVAPLALAEKVGTVLVSPDGALHHVPFSALFGVREVTCVPSATSYSVLLPEGALRGDGVLAIGDPQYGPATRGAVASVRSGLHLTPLPASRKEVLYAGDVVLLGAEATEAGLRFSLGRRPRWRAVHFACHGLVDRERPTLSSLALTSTPEDDGFLTALDLSRIRVPADLVVLSACHSGCGKVLRGEGTLGLARAFLSSGAPRVLVSLGAVDDEATGVLMRHFYELWKAGLPASCALRHAQAHVRSHEQWRHPYYWASWTLWGLPD
jgi:CHAT domain-containing protein